MKSFLFSLFVLAGIILPFQNTKAVGIGIKPNEVKLEAGIGSVVESEILINNAGNEPAVFHVYPDDFKDNIKLSPNGFNLDPGSSKIVKITSNFYYPGIYETDISVVARSLNLNSFQASPGIKIPIEITISFEVWLFIFAVLVFCCIIVVIVKIKKKL